jgi:hypothetical protein
MPVLVNTTIGLDISAYDQLAAGLSETLKTSPGFRAHVAYPVENGFTAAEIWDSEKDHRVFFESAVKPNLPSGVRLEVQVIELRNTIGL